MIHGHQFDPLIWNGPVPFFFSWIVVKLRRLGFRRVADFLENRFYMACQRFARILGPPGVAARKALVTGKYDVVIMGHTHQPACIRFGNGIYANSGAVSPDHLGYASIDTHTGKVELREYVGYAKYRKLLVEGGVKIYEMRPDAASRALYTAEARPPWWTIHWFTLVHSISTSVRPGSIQKSEC